MNRIMGIVMGIIGIVIVFIMFPLIMDSSHDIQTDDYTQAEASVTTGAGETAADVVLTKALYDDDNTWVTSVTSSEGTDTPAVGTYTAATKTLNVTGLAESTSRTLTIVYEYDGLTSYTGMSAFVGLTPLLVLISIIAVVIGGTWFAMSGRSNA